MEQCLEAGGCEKKARGLRETDGVRRRRIQVRVFLTIVI